VERREGSEIAVEKPIVSRGTVSVRDFPTQNPWFHVEHMWNFPAIATHLDQPLASICLEPSSPSVFHVERVVSEFCCGMFHTEAEQCC
jgi:hypothetical protein